MRRQRDLERLECGDTLDLLVVGGGAAGAAILRAAALAGLRAALCERQDYASGTTGRTTRLVHGGLRYLEHGHLRLVVESLRERRILIDIAPHRVAPLALHIPLYRDAGRPRWRVRLGLWLYDRLAGAARLGPSGPVGARTIEERLGGLATTGLRGVAVLHDARALSPERLIIETLVDAVEIGAIAANRLELVALERDGDALAALLADTAGNRELRVRARAVVNAAGPWIAEVDRRAAARQPARVLWSRGTHVLIAPFEGAPTVALLVESPRDRRPVFILPSDGYLLVGTTEVAHRGDPSAARATDDEVDYLCETLAHVWPAARGRPPYAAYAGVRALPAGTDAARADRRHRLIAGSPAGYFTLLGGKLTTHRLAGEETVDAVWRLLGRPPRNGHPTAIRPLPGAPLRPELDDVARLAARHGLPRDEAAALFGRWGARAWAVTALSPPLPPASTASAVPAPSDPARQAAAGGLRPEEIRFAMQSEGALTLDDVLLRRTNVGFDPRLTRHALQAAAWIWAGGGDHGVPADGPGRVGGGGGGGPSDDTVRVETAARREAMRVAALLTDVYRRQLD
ncbi:MAG: glycerol-3-phosphate dehydrogenase/oxidase [Candidatus Eiseniibacteriota bacterium]|jgi:glycerol-3-phosphate dehydrogenase